MLQIGKYNTLTVAREVEFGLYLADDRGTEVLIPRRYVTPEMTVGSDVTVFVYKDSDDRPVATTERPYATVGEFAYLQVRDVNKTGAFLDWGLLKDLLVPYAEQKSRMRPGGTYLVYVYLDTVTGRIAASARIERYLGNVLPDYRPGQEVSALIIEHTHIGFRAIVDNLHWGMIYDSELYTPLDIEQVVTARVKQVRPDGKIDLTILDRTADRVDAICHAILRALRDSGGTLTVTDASSPDEIRLRFRCSKKDYKKALGHLYKKGRITLAKDHITLCK